MATLNNRTYTRDFVYQLLEGVKGKTLGEVDDVGSRQFDRTLKSPKITGIAGDVVEQSVFGYSRDSKQECDIVIDGVHTELKTTAVRIPKSQLRLAKGKVGEDYYKLFEAKEGISITGVTFTPTFERNFDTSHFWEKAEHLLIVFYEYQSYDVVPAYGYRDFPIIDYCYNKFSDSERSQLKNDWELVRDYLAKVYNTFPKFEDRYSNLVGFTHTLRPELLLIELIPSFKRKNGSYQKPRYRLKKSFIDSIVRGHFNKTRDEVDLSDSFSSFAELDKKCHHFRELYKGKNFEELKEILQIGCDVSVKDFGAKCILKMFNAECKELNQIADFNKAGIVAKTIKMTPNNKRTEDMKLFSVDFEEWTDRDLEFEDSAVFEYFMEHSFLCPIFYEQEKGNPAKTTFEGFKRFAYDDDFIHNNVHSTWQEVRHLVHHNFLQWEYILDKNGNIEKNKSGSYKGAPNLPKSSNFDVFFRGSATDSSDRYRTEVVNGIKMLPQFVWIKGSYIVNRLNNLPYL